MSNSFLCSLHGLVFVFVHAKVMANHQFCICLSSIYMCTFEHLCVFICIVFLLPTVLLGLSSYTPWIESVLSQWFTAPGWNYQFECCQMLNWFDHLLLLMAGEVPFDFALVHVVRRMERGPARTRPFHLACVGCADMHHTWAVTFAGVKLWMCRTCGFCAAGGLVCCNLSRELQLRPRWDNLGSSAEVP